MLKQDIYVHLMDGLFTKLAKLGLDERHFYMYQKLYIAGNGNKIYIQNKDCKEKTGKDKTRFIEILNDMEVAGCVKVSFVKDISLFGDKRERRLIEFLVHPNLNEMYQ